MLVIAQRVVGDVDHAARVGLRQGEELAVSGVLPVQHAVGDVGGLAVHGPHQGLHLGGGVAGLIGPDLHAVQIAVPVEIVGVHGLLAVEPAHGVAVGGVDVLPALAADGLGVHQLAARADVGLSLLQGAGEVDGGLPQHGIGVAVPLLPGDGPVGGGVGGDDLRHSGGGRAGGAGDGPVVQVLGRVGGGMIQVAPAHLGQLHGGDAGELEGGVIAGTLRVPGQASALGLEQVGEPVGLAVHGAHLHAGGAQAADHVELDVADHPLLLGGGELGGVVPGAQLAVLLTGEADEADLRVGGHVLQRVRHGQQRAHAGAVVAGAVGGDHGVVVGGDHQDVRIGGPGGLGGDHVGAGPAVGGGVGLQLHLIAHVLEAVLEIFHGVLLALGADGPVVAGQLLNVPLEHVHVRQVGGPLQDHQGLAHGDGADGGRGWCRWCRRSGRSGRTTAGDRPPSQRRRRRPDTGPTPGRTRRGSPCRG